MINEISNKVQENAEKRINDKLEKYGSFVAKIIYLTIEERKEEVFCDNGETICIKEKDIDENNIIAYGKGFELPHM